MTSYFHIKLLYGRIYTVVSFIHKCHKSTRQDLSQSDFFHNLNAEMETKDTIICVTTYNITYQLDANLINIADAVNDE